MARKYPAAGMKSHSWMQRTFWPAWFANDNVHLRDDELPYLLRRCPSNPSVVEGVSQVPYIGWVMPKVPYFTFVSSPEEA